LRIFTCAGGGHDAPRRHHRASLSRAAAWDDAATRVQTQFRDWREFPAHFGRARSWRFRLSRGFTYLALGRFFREALALTYVVQAFSLAAPRAGSEKIAVVQAFRPAVSGRPKGLHYIRSNE
jgi:hypothetical protein